MKLWSDGFKDGGVMPSLYAAGILGKKGFGPNLNPPLAWSEVPEGTQSLVLVCNDPDAPAVRDDVGKTDREVPAGTPRTNFYHWMLVDLPVSVHSIAEGEFSSGFVVKGKPGPNAAHGCRQGVNDYTPHSQGDAQMEGKYFGYDGPYPPFNDCIKHRYVFTLYALGVDRLAVEGEFTGEQVMTALAALRNQGKVLAQASLTGLYTLNPRLV